MSQELSNQLRCILLRNGIEFWVEENRAADFIVALNSNQRFLDFEGRLINSADVTGVFTPLDMEDFNKKKNGFWKCKRNKWHEKGAECICGRYDYLEK